MVAAIEVYFDQTASSRIRKVWDAMEDAGIPSLRDLTHRRHRPHLSLVAAPKLDAEPVREALAGIEVAMPMTMALDHIGIFPGRVLWLGPAPRRELMDHQRQVYERLDAAGISLDPYYRPDAWVPHVTMSMRIPHRQMSEAIKLCMDVLPIAASITGGAVADHARDVYQAW